MSDLSVLNVLITTPDTRVGGAVRAGLQLGKHLKKYVGVDTVIMESDYNEEIAEEFNMVNELSQIPSYTLLRDVSRSLVNYEENFSNVLIWTRLSPPSSLESYDIVHVHNAVPLAGMVSVAVSCRVKRIPYCVTTHGISKIPDLPHEMRLSRIQRLAFKCGFLNPYFWVLKNAAFLLSLSKKDKRRLRKRFPEASISVVPNGVELKDPREEASKQADQVADLEPEEPLLLFVGKLRQSKGVNELLDAYQMLNEDATLVIVGPTHDKELKERVENFEEKEVQYRGYVNRQTLDDLFHRADLFVFPTRSDVFPLVNLEAMAARTPVISTTVGGIPEQVDETSGVLVPPNDSEGLAESISRLINNKSHRQKLAMGARKRVERNFSWDSVARRTAEHYRRHLS